MGDVASEVAYWDTYRAAYETMTYEEVRQAHRIIWSTYPDQSHHSVAKMDAFFASLTDRSSVLEVGGWRGEAAARTLAAYSDIGYWDNFEISIDAVAHPATDDVRYSAIVPETWVWDTETPRDYSVAVLAHVIEHVSDAQLEPFIAWLDRLDVHDIYVEAPLWDGGQGWYGGNTAHILNIGWNGVIETFGRYGYRVRERHLGDRPDFHVLFMERGS